MREIRASENRHGTPATLSGLFPFSDLNTLEIAELLSALLKKKSLD